MPLVQHSLQLMLQHAKDGKISVPRVIEKMCHAPAELFHIEKRGFLREGYHADIVILDPKADYTVSKNNLLYKCGWSPIEGTRFNTSIDSTIVSGHLAFHQDKFDESKIGSRLLFSQ